MTEIIFGTTVFFFRIYCLRILSSEVLSSLSFLFRAFIDQKQHGDKASAEHQLTTGLRLKNGRQIEVHLVHCFLNFLGKCISFIDLWFNKSDSGIGKKKLLFSVL